MRHVKILIIALLFAALALAADPPAAETADMATATFDNATYVASKRLNDAMDEIRRDYVKALQSSETEARHKGDSDEDDALLAEIDRVSKPGSDVSDGVPKGKQAIKIRDRFKGKIETATTIYNTAVGNAKQKYISDLELARSNATKAGDPTEAKRIKNLIDPMKQAAGIFPIAAAPKKIDLLKTVKLPTDRISGDWTADQTTGAFTAPAAKPARLQFHATPAGEYDYSVTFNRQVDGGFTGVDLLAEYQGHRFAFNVGFGFAKGDNTKSLVGISDLKHKNYISDGTQRWSAFPLAGQEVTIVVCVRARSVAAYLEPKGGKRSEIGHWPVDYADASIKDEWGVPSGIGVSVNNNGVTVSAAQLTEVVRPHGHQVETVAADGMRHIDLLAGISVDDDKVNGEWTIGAGGLECSMPENGDSRIIFCKAPTCPYTYKISYQTSGGDAGVGQVAVDAGKSFVWFMGTKNTAFDFEAFGGPAESKWSAPGALLLENGHAHTSEVSVKPDSVSASYDGVKVRELKTNGADLSVWWGWDIGPNKIGIATYRAMVITSAELIVPVSGPKAADLFPYAAAGKSK